MPAGDHNVSVRRMACHNLEKASFIGVDVFKNNQMDNKDIYITWFLHVWLCSTHQLSGSWTSTQVQGPTQSQRTATTAPPVVSPVLPLFCHCYYEIVYSTIGYERTLAPSYQLQKGLGQ